ncbi:hypothetical protein [Streptomyces sp. N35]|uniref:hypothetical protein n=1 Tax=Streptomyces sp. N35 TaxID=2795730 RepID=UPI0018F72D92|nr:hypothetical protein [Streptomyces sp. N35]
MSEPQDPITGLVADAVQVHEIYLAYVQAGFTEQQALELKTFLVACLGGRS